ncbi:hypothetical protein [Pseudonocardia lacus]|uniref:hypothetical protein n=1 Tax=Pseudonocardia lacus TaxID=2835865 RepID=UPI001BDC1EF9|nr:hypothetical protein [Pseudonocardia lacus]
MGTLLALATTGCASAVVGAARADPEAAAQVARERGCRAAEDEMVTTIDTLVRRIDSDASALLDAEEIMRQIPVRDLGEKLRTFVWA